MYTPHTVTLYHLIEDDITAEKTYNITVLDGVFLDIAQGTNIAKTGMNDADRVTLFVPFSVNAYDPITGNKKNYLPPKTWNEVSDKESYYTFETGGKSSSADCFFIKGEIIDTSGYSAMRTRYDFIYDVTTVDIRDFGSARMQHFQVGGK